MALCVASTIWWTVLFSCIALGNTYLAAYFMDRVDVCFMVGKLYIHIAYSRFWLVAFDPCTWSDMYAYASCL